MCNFIFSVVPADSLALLGARPSAEAMMVNFRGHFKNSCELFQCCIKIASFSVWVRYLVWNFKGALWNSTQNILPIHWKIWFFYSRAIFKTLRFKSSYTFLKWPPGPSYTWGWHLIQSLFHEYFVVCISLNIPLLSNLCVKPIWQLLCRQWIKICF